jgi:ketosteroid isomerase-like protein
MRAQKRFKNIMLKLTSVLFLPLAVLLLSFPTPFKAQNLTTSPETDAVRHQIEANNKAIRVAIRNRDFAILEKLFSPQMIVNNPANKIYTRADVFAALKRGGLNYLSLKGTVESFEVFGDIAVEMGLEDFIMAEGPAAHKPLQRRYTDVWQRSGENWVQIARQATILNVDAAWVYGSSTPDSQSKEH